MNHKSLLNIIEKKMRVERHIYRESERERDFLFYEDFILFLWAIIYEIMHGDI